MRIAQISDLHIQPGGARAYGVVDTAALLERCVARLNALRPPPDVVLATGDLVQEGTPEEYARLRGILAPLAAPLHVLPGNHDDRTALRAAFPDAAGADGGGFVQYALEDGPLRVVALDTLWPGEEAGRLCAERLGWLERTLAARPAAPTLLALHHPPFPTGLAHLDGIGLREGAAELERIVRAHPQVRRVVCGHLHRAIHTRWAGVPASVAPATCHQAALELRPDQPAAFVAEPPGFHLHWWRDDGAGAGELVTHLAYIEDYGGPVNA